MDGLRLCRNLNRVCVRLGEAAGVDTAEVEVEVEVTASSSKAGRAATAAEGGIGGREGERLCSGPFIPCVGG
jgi:hypothetical protein